MALIATVNCETKLSKLTSKSDFTLSDIAINCPRQNIPEWYSLAPNNVTPIGEMIMDLCRLIGSAAILAFLAGCQSEPTVQTGPNAEITYDGLHRVDKSILKMAWVKPDLNLSGYNKLRLVGEGIEYRAVKKSGTSRANSSRSEFPMDAKARARLEEITGEVFVDEIGKSQHYTIVEEEGPDVLEIRAALLDVVSNVPPQAMARNDYFLSRIGEATLVLEIRDSESNEIFARAIDRRGIDPIVVTRSSMPMNISEVRREMRRWAAIIREAIDSFHDEHSG